MHTVIIVAFLPSRTSYNLLIHRIIPDCFRPRGPNPIYLNRSLLDNSACHLIKGAVFLVSLLVLEKMKLLLLILLLIVGEVIFLLIGGWLSSRSSEEFRFWTWWVCAPITRILHSCWVILMNELIQHVPSAWLFAAVWLRALKNLEIADSAVKHCRGTLFAVRPIQRFIPIASNVVGITRKNLMLYDSTAQYLISIIASASLNASYVDEWGILVLGNRILGIQN